VNMKVIFGEVIDGGPENCIHVTIIPNTT
jgi:hypothetical protein